MDLADRLEAWGENEPNAAWIRGDVLGVILDDCRLGAQRIRELEDQAASRKPGTYRRIRLGTRARQSGNAKIGA
jgi:hypothetical protein